VVIDGSLKTKSNRADPIESELAQKRNKMCEYASHKGEGQGNRVKEESSSFLKKRTKKLLIIGRAPAARARK
jgi:hypothetical protein